SAVIVKKDFQPKKSVNTALIRVEDPYTGFTLLMEEYNRLITYQKTGIEEPAFIGESTTVGKNVYRGAFSYIGSNVTIG
ncbi:MAG: UDP-3-O-(3-hydroxymyristoyl)glucosamine N-acyltransferase, partial [Aliifodinibius sp.]|nr:UDP-3-O-(3-hydroxymyristoyl)glucosamine N-acyltransferase [Fodinibius sp.]NIV12736.1 UDP-3-O-(3-hydroxymyristoyl)glucosamine N-acyltransferase [Fodinibius sp.]NIY25471.1 UDP-3-O-(3-hydroxymyristoyl)glucosamine N-acyltransferase [Fodinibius sp.]